MVGEIQPVIPHFVFRREAAGMRWSGHWVVPTLVLCTFRIKVSLRKASSGDRRNSKAETKWLGPIKETNLSLSKFTVDRDTAWMTATLQSLPQIHVGAKDMCTFKLALSYDMLLGGIRDQL